MLYVFFLFRHDAVTSDINKDGGGLRKNWCYTIYTEEVLKRRGYCALTLPNHRLWRR